MGNTVFRNGIAITNLDSNQSGGGEPASYIKSASVSQDGKTLELVNKDGSVLEFSASHPYISLERLRAYLYRVTFDSLPEDNGEGEIAFGGCSSYVSDGKLYTNLDWDYDNTASFIVRTRDFVGQSFIKGLNDGNLNDEQIAQLPYRLHRGINNYGIKLAAHVLFNDWGWSGSGNKSINLTRLPFIILSKVKSIDTIESNLEGVLDNLYCPEGLSSMGYLLQFIITDGEVTYAILPPTSEDGNYELVNITSYPKLTNFRWVGHGAVSRFDMDLQTRPTGIERYNMIPCDLEELRFTFAYEQPERLSEFIGLRGTTKSSTSEELMAIYEDARSEYLDRERDGKTWQTMESSVYGDKLEAMWIQENWEDNVIDASGEISGDYEILYNKPSIESHILSGNSSLSDIGISEATLTDIDNLFE